MERARPDPCGDLLGAEAEFVDQPPEASGGLDRVEVLPLQVLDERDLELGLIVQLADDGRDALEAGGRGRAQASLAGDEPVAVDRLGDEDRLQDAVLADALGEGGQLRLVEASPGLVRVRADAVDRDVGGSGLAGAPLRDQRREATAETVDAFGANGHDITMRCGADLRLAGASPAASPRPERARNSRASSAYAAAPRDSGAYWLIGRPWLGASDSRTLRGMIVS